MADYTTIDKPSDYFNTKLYTGNGTAIGSGGLAISGIGFAPSWVWLKNRTTGDRSHQVYDVIRGVTKGLKVNSSDAENTSSERLTAFGSDGFTVGNNGDVNESGDAHVSWNWKAGTSVSGNTTGSGTAKSYSGSVNTDASFSITLFTGNGTANHTLPHNLGVAPDWFIIKKKIGTGDSTARDWNVYHKSLGNTKRIALNSTGAVSTSNEYWNNTSPTSSVINLGTNDQINGDNNTYICYAFAEKQGYSKFGSYKGNGNANGSYIHLGFSAAFIIIKKSSNAGNNWYMWDNKRNTSNLTNKYLNPDLSSAEGTANYGYIDFLSNGFKTRATGNTDEINQSGHTFIYMAFAEQPFVTSTGVPATAR